jgi:hypothetical protein
LDQAGLHIGAPLRQFRGILTGVPICDAKDHPRPHEHEP